LVEISSLVELANHSKWWLEPVEKLPYEQKEEVEDWYSSQDRYAE
jgi:hypothetical protein